MNKEVSFNKVKEDNRENCLSPTSKIFLGIKLTLLGVFLITLATMFNQLDSTTKELILIFISLFSFYLGLFLGIVAAYYLIKSVGNDKNKGIKMALIASFLIAITFMPYDLEQNKYSGYGNFVKNKYYDEIKDYSLPEFRN